MSIEYKRFGLAYNGKDILRNVSFETKETGVVSIMGASGCGKSTLLSATNRLIDVDRRWTVTGDILLDGESVFDPSVDVTLLRQKVGLVLQHPVAFNQSVLENVAFPLRHGHKRLKTMAAYEVAAQALEWVGLASEISITDMKARDISGGQQQRMAIARALALEPKVLMMDEPTSALDPEATKTIECIIEELAQTTLILLVTHNPSQADRLADQLVFLHATKGLLEEGGANDVLHSPSSKELVSFLEAANF